MPPTGVDGKRKIIVVSLSTSQVQLLPLLRRSTPLSVIESAGLIVQVRGNGCSRAGPPGPLRSKKKSTRVGAGLALEGSVMRNGSSSCGCLGMNDTSTVPLADDSGGWPPGLRSSTKARKRTAPVQALSGTSKLKESASESRLGAEVA